MDGHAYELLQLSMKWKQLYHHAVDQLCCANIRRTMLLRTCYCQLNALAQRGEVPELARLNCNASVHVIKKDNTASHAHRTCFCNALLRHSHSTTTTLTCNMKTEISMKYTAPAGYIYKKFYSMYCS